MSSIPPTLPFDVAKTYGVRAPRPISVRPLAQAPSAAQSSPIETQPLARIDRADKADLTKVSSGIGRLLGARVETPAFEGVSAAPPQTTQSQAPPRRADAFAFYHHPADRNAAATGVDVGRSLDVSG